MIFYASSHTGIVYDCNEHRQYLLQGHVSICNVKLITCNVILITCNHVLITG